MSITRILTMAFALVLSLGTIEQTARAQFLGTSAWDRKTTMTINVAWEVPGKTFGPGTYIFRLLNVGTGVGATRNVVQIFNRDETELLATVLGLTSYRMNSDGPIFHFYEVASGAPEKLHTWFYSSFVSGIEFAYAGKVGAN